MEEDAEEAVKSKKNPRQNANPFSGLTFWWLLPYFWKGYKTEYYAKDLFEVLKQHESEALGNKFQNAWECEIRRSKNPSVSWTLARVFGLRVIFFGIFFGILELIVKMIQPVAIGYLVSSFSPDKKNQFSEEGMYKYSGIIIGTSILSIFIYFPTLMGLCHSALKMKVALASLIYRKSLRLSVKSLDEAGGIGHVMNLISSDVSKLDLAIIFVHNLWIGPLVTIFATMIMYQEIGGSAFVGIFLVIFFIPFQAWLTKISARIHKQAAKKTDERLTLMCEIIKGIHVLKIYAWEKPFSKIILELRKKEIQLIKQASYIKGVHIAFTVFRSRTAIFSSVLSYVLFGNVLTAGEVFVVTACFNTMKRTMTDLFSYAIELIILARVSMHRIQKFLLLEESFATIDFYDHNINQKNHGKYPQNGDLNILPVLSPQIVLQDVRTIWKNQKNGFQLKDINIDIRISSLVALIGPVGSGKTSLLNVILREFESLGRLDSRGKISYASQEPWLFNRSIRKNIILAEKYEEQRYTKVLEITALIEDLRSFPQRDKTFVGERGSALSGGQKIRVNLARALYRDADIYLLDDPLSALDSNVSNHIFKEIRQFLSRKICILVTHQHQFASEVDHVIIMENGKVRNQGSYEKLKDEIMDCAGSLQNSERLQNSTEPEKCTEKKVPVVLSSQGGSKGKVTFGVYKEYLKNLGHPFVVGIIFLLFLAGQISASSSDYFISYWVNMEQAQHLNNSNFLEDSEGWFLVQKTCIFVYSILNVLTIILTIASSFLFFNSSLEGASRIHNQMFLSIMYTKMNFFNQNSTGNILNRFSKDIQNMDEMIPSAVVNCLQTTLSIFGIVTVVSVVQPWLMVPTFVAFCILMVLRNIYIVVGSNLKRLEATTRSPMLSHVSASLQGLTTVRSAHILPRLQMEFDGLQNTHSTARYLVQAAARMFAMWLETTCVLLLIFLIAGFLVSETSDFGGNVGLAITQVMGMVGLIQWAVRQSSDLEACMTSVERVLEYCRLVPEWKGPENLPVDRTWPKEGRIEFQNVGFSYDSKENTILRDLNFSVEPTEKIGIVGRTGNGKSSIINAILQFYNPSGKIIIDDVDCRIISPNILRSSIGVIPQESVIFSGSVRMNLDPNRNFSDEILWKVLELTELKNCIAEFGNGLETKLTPGGTNLSAGQRQLLCAARAFLKDTKILILDEPTASLDPDTEKALDRALETFSKSRTVLTVAHRLENVMKSDKIMVLGDGEILEFEEPYKLLENPKSYLKRLLDNEINEKIATRLREITKEHYLERHKNDPSIFIEGKIAAKED